MCTFISVVRSRSLRGSPCNSRQVKAGVTLRHSFRALHSLYVISFDLMEGIFLFSIIAFFSVKKKVLILNIISCTIIPFVFRWRPWCYASRPSHEYSMWKKKPVISNTCRSFCFNTIVLYLKYIIILYSSLKRILSLETNRIWRISGDHS